MTYRSLVRASALYAVGNFLPRVGAFLLIPLYVRFLSGGEYGTVSLITAVAGVLAVLYRLGLDGALMRLHFDYEGGRQRALYGTVTGVALVSALAGAALTVVLIGPVFGQLFTGLAFLPFGLLAIGIGAATAVSFVPAIFFRATAQASRFLRYTVAVFVTSSAVSVALVWFGWGAPGVLIGQLAGGLVAVAITISLLIRARWNRYDPSVIPGALRFGLPLVPHLVSGWVLRLADRLLIGILIGLPAAAALAEVGAYSLGYELGYVVTVVASSFNAAWSPWFFRIAGEADAPSLFTGMTTIVMAALLAIGVSAAALAPQIVAAIARPEYQSAASVLPVVAMASVAFAFYTMMTTPIFYAKATARLALITASAAGLNVIANIALIPRMGIEGAAWATLLAYSFFAVATWRYATSVYPVRIDARRLVLLSGGALLALLAANLTDGLNSPVLTASVRATVVLLFTAFAAAVAWSAARKLPMTQLDSTAG